MKSIVCERAATLLSYAECQCTKVDLLREAAERLKKKISPASYVLYRGNRLSRARYNNKLRPELGHGYFILTQQIGATSKEYLVKGKVTFMG